MTPPKPLSWSVDWDHLDPIEKLMMGFPLGVVLLISAAILSLTEGQGRIAAEIDYHAVLQADLSLELKACRRLDLRGVSVCEFSGEKIIRLTDYS